MSEKKEENEEQEFEVKSIKNDFDKLVQAVKDLPVDTTMKIKVSDPEFKKRLKKAFGDE